MKTSGRNAPCSCKSGRKFKKCCLRVIDERSAGPRIYEKHTARQLILEEIHTFKKTFEVKLADQELKIKKDISDSDVRFFCEKVFNLWNSKPDLVACLPKPEDLKYRATYFGTPDMFTTVNLIARYSLYCDQIIAIDPFGYIRDFDRSHKDSPLNEPQAWVRQIVLDGIYLCSLEDWIKTDLVFVTAFPLGFSHPERQKHITAAAARIKKKSREEWHELIEESFENEFIAHFTPAELDALEKPSTEGVRLMREILEDDELFVQVSRASPGITKEELKKEIEDAECRRRQIERAKKYLASEPRRYHWALKRQFRNTMLKIGAVMNLEDAMWLANITGSHIVTDKRTLWNEILSYEPRETREASPAKLRQSLTTLGEAFQKLQFRFLNDIPLGFALRIRQEDRLASFRSFLRDFWNKVRQVGVSEAERLGTIQEFQDRLAAEYEEFKREFAQIEKSVYQKTAVGGIGGAGAILSGNLGLAIPSIGLLVAALGEEGKKETQRINALSVFLDLERR